LIVDEVREELSFELKKRRVVNACVGIYYTAVLLDDQSLGISHTLPEGDNPLCGRLIGLNAYEIAKESSNPLSRSITVAILNAVQIGKYERGDLLPLLKGSSVCVFGYSPRPGQLNFPRVTVYDFAEVKERTEGPITVKPFSTLKEEVCDVAIIYGSALVNGKIEEILRRVTSKERVLYGISSVDAESVLRTYGFNFIARYDFSDKHLAFRYVCEGGGPRELQRVYFSKFRRL
jgi:uncharacterized protein (DUF4213/DUF364 family)